MRGNHEGAMTAFSGTLERGGDMPHMDSCAGASLLDPLLSDSRGWEKASGASKGLGRVGGLGTEGALILRGEYNFGASLEGRRSVAKACRLPDAYASPVSMMGGRIPLPETCVRERVRVDWPTTSLPTSFPGVHYQCLDEGVSDEEVTDKGVSEKEVSDEEVTDEGISDKVSDKEVTDEVTDEEDRLEDRDKDIDEDGDAEEELEIMKLEESLGETFKENRKENVVELLEKRVKHDRDESALSTPVPSAKIRIVNILFFFIQV